MNSYQAILFDLDGTLFDSRMSVVAATYATVSRFQPGCLSLQDVQARFGEPFSSFVTLLGLEDHAEEMLAYYVQQVANNQERLVKSYPFVCEMIPLLREKYQLAIVTNKERELVEQGLQLFGLVEHFDAIICIEDVQQGKPSPEGIEKAIKLLGTTPERCLMVGDTHYDMLAAQRAGVESVLMRYELNEVDGQLSSQLPTYEFHTFQELVDELLAKQQLVQSGRKS